MSNNKKTVLVTGASRGIGRAIAEKFLNEDYIVYGTYFTSKTKMLDIQKQYGKDNFIICGSYDFQNLEDTNKLVDELSNVSFDSIICSAGMFSENDDFINFDLDEFNKTMNCNFYTPMTICIKLQNKIKNNGSIVIMSSNDAYPGAFASLSYSISKSALLSLNKCLCVNFGRRGIRVNSVAPGAINTDMNTPEQEFEAPLYTPIERIGQPSEVAEVVYFLASTKSSFINGENITIDGGYSDVSILLKSEANRMREYKGYQDIFNEYQLLKDGDSLIHLSLCLSYEWDGNEEETELINQNYAAEKRGVKIKRIIMVDPANEDRIKNSKFMKDYLKNITANTKVYLVTNAEVSKNCPEDYKLIGDGYGVFNNEKAFIDSYSNIDSIGYMLTGESMVNPITESFNNIFAKIENGEIKQFDLNK